MDDRAGAAAARSSGLTATGTLGVLGLAAQHGLLKLSDAFNRIKRTNFRYRQDTLKVFQKSICCIQSDFCSAQADALNWCKPMQTGRNYESGMR
jgi:hypothetical protein